MGLRLWDSIWVSSHWSGEKLAGTHSSPASLSLRAGLCVKSRGQNSMWGVLDTSSVQSVK